MVSEDSNENISIEFIIIKYYILYLYTFTFRRV